MTAVVTTNGTDSGAAVQVAKVVAAISPPTVTSSTTILLPTATSVIIRGHGFDATAPNNTVTLGAMWDATYLYVGVRVLDANLFNDSANVWDDDSVEVFIDANHNAGTTYDSFDRQYLKGYNDTGQQIARIAAILRNATGNDFHGYKHATFLRRIQRRMQVVQLDDIEAVVTGELENGLVYLEVVGEQGTPRIARIHVKVFAASDEPGAMRALFEHVIDRLPLVCTLRAAVALTIDLTLTS